MRNILLILILLISSQILFCQNIDEIEFDKTIKAEISASINQFLYSKTKENIKRIDSIKTIERNDLKKKIIGTWEFLEGKCSDCILFKDVRKKNKVKKFIVITNTVITFYNKKIKKKNIVKTETIEFTNQFDYFSDLTNLVFKDKNIWDIKVDKTNNYLKIYRSGKETNKGRNRLISGISTDYYKRI